MKQLITPISIDDVIQLNIGDIVTLTGYIYTGRDAVLPRLVKLIQYNKLGDHNIDLEGAVIFHTAVSLAGVGPTSSNKLEIESSIPVLSKAGVRVHLGKGAISEKTVRILHESNSIYAVIPPITALLESKTLEREIVAFPELGMEAMYKLNVVEYQILIAAAHGKSIY